MVRQTPLLRVLVHVLLALCSVLGSWSMTHVLWLIYKYYCYYSILKVQLLFAMRYHLQGVLHDYQTARF